MQNISVCPLSDVFHSMVIWVLGFQPICTFFALFMKTTWGSCLCRNHFQLPLLRHSVYHLKYCKPLFDLVCLNIEKDPEIQRTALHYLKKKKKKVLFKKKYHVKCVKCIFFIEELINFYNPLPLLTVLLCTVYFELFGL